MNLRSDGKIAIVTGASRGIGKAIAIGLAEAGATAALHPGGSVRDAEVIAAADAHGMALVTCGIRHFKH